MVMVMMVAMVMMAMLIMNIKSMPFVMVIDIGDSLVREIQHIAVIFLPNACQMEMLCNAMQI